MVDLDSSFKKSDRSDKSPCPLRLNISFVTLAMALSMDDDKGEEEEKVDAAGEKVYDDEEEEEEEEGEEEGEEEEGEMLMLLMRVSISSVVSTLPKIGS